MKKIRIKLDKILKQEGISQRQLKIMIDQKHFNGEDKFRTATISEIYNNQRKTINREHLEIIFDTLGLDRVDQLIEFVEE
ncbi:helix-turn-helix domain-containing protein [Virgibacillus halodenitrificans]|uniref:Helix-turn-helix domain-containing protein n=1 Tax=Virgibacillus halodenitrificans TaxID=1482 RepID=A0ABR7VM77_VIRHA|nr:helix-turn-helix domain-containing protein [Virgibacillus halodenitrificans]MBD1222788.1 helix-turn-helix domain-containing protein [Virgibacillus halodenitrificans]